MRVNRTGTTLKREPIYQRFGKGIAKYRIALDLTQAELAKRVNRPRSYINNIEGGWQRVYLLDVLILAKALELDPTTFFDEVMKGASP